jgi:hypothetical protein
LPESYIEQLIDAVHQQNELINSKYKLLVNLFPPGKKYGFYGIKNGVLSFYQKERGSYVLYRFPNDEIKLLGA